MSRSAAAPLQPRPDGRKRLLFASFVILMLALTALFWILGDWQLRRLAEKDALVATISARADLPVLTVPAPEQWRQFDPSYFDFRKVGLSGRFRLADTVLVFTSLPQARGAYSGPGYWVVTPLELDSGGLVFVNRGFVPQSMQAQFTGGGAGPEGSVTLTGLARVSEAANSFTPGPDQANRIEWVRNVDRLTALVDTGESPVAPFYVDLPAGAPDALPQGGETVMAFSNNHLGYAMTWFGFGLITPALLVFWIWRQRAPPA